MKKVKFSYRGQVHEGYVNKNNPIIGRFYIVYELPDIESCVFGCNNNNVLDWHKPLSNNWTVLPVKVIEIL